MGLDSVGGTVTRSVRGHMKKSHTNNDTSVIWFGSERAQSKHQCPVQLQWHHLTLKLNHRNHINYGKVCLQCCKFTPNTKCTTFSRKLMLGKTLDGEFKLLCIRESDNDDVDDSTDEDSPPNLSIGQRVVVQCGLCGADIGCIGWNTSQCDAKECRVLEVAKCCRYLLQTCWCNKAKLLVFHKFQ